jgi:hypothetical protein
MSATTVKLLHAAAEIVGGTRALAQRLGIGEVLLAKFMGGVDLPDALLLRAVDIILQDRDPAAAPPAEDSLPRMSGLS